MSKVTTQEQTKVVSVTIDMTPDEARRLRSKLGDVPSLARSLDQMFGGYGGSGQFGSLQQAPRDGLDDLRTQLKLALEGKN